MRFPNFVGPSYVSQSPLVNVERCVNFYPELVGEVPGSKAQYALYPTPGLSAFATYNQTPGRGIFAQDGRCFAVAGSAAYEVFSTGTINTIGFMLRDGNPATFASSGDAGAELVISSGGKVYLFDLVTSAFTKVADGATHVAYIDGFFVALDGTTSTFKKSNYLDGLTGWTGTNTALRDKGSDRWLAMIVAAPQIWLFGSQTTEVWYNAGLAPFPFAPDPSVLIKYGILAPFSAAVVDNAPMWLSQSAEGAGVVMRAEGAIAKKVSTHALDFAIQGYTTTTDAIGFPYQDQGHSFYILTFPTEGKTWAWDAATGFWHERLFWNSNTGLYEAWRPQAHCYAFNKHLVADRSTGNIYQMGITIATDADGNGVRRMRRAPHLAQENAWLYCDEFQLDLEVGLGLSSGQGADPQIMLRVSRNGGKTYGNERWQSAGAIGAYATRAIWNRLGRGRDFVFEVTTSDPVPYRITQAFLEIEAEVMA